VSVPMHGRDVRALAASFVATTLGGCAFVFWSWASRGHALEGALRCLTLACAMAAVHVCGLRAYRHQAGTFLASLRKFARQVDRNVERYRRTHDVRWILVRQGAVILLGTIVLDNGNLMRMAAAGSAVYWIGVLARVCTRDEG
jgi:hypothetical protein